MCVIIDANVAADAFRNPDGKDHKPVFTWIEKKNGCLVLGGKLSKELYKIKHVKRYVLELYRSGRARTYTNDDIEPDEKTIKPHCVSNDAHVIALARISGARVLYSHDVKLGRDFRNPRLISGPRGGIYKRSVKSHIKLLKHTSACKPHL